LADPIRRHLSDAGALKQLSHDYEDGVLQIRYGEYDSRVPEYSFCVTKAFDEGIFRDNSPVLDVGCRDPYEGLLKFMRNFGWGRREDYADWEGKYVGVDLSFSEFTAESAEKDGLSTLVEYDVDGALLPFPPTKDHPFKQFACGFLIETLEHIKDRDKLINEMKRCCGMVFVIGPNSDYCGFRDPYDNISELSARDFRLWDFQKMGFMNFNGRKEVGGDLYRWDNGQSETSSEIWGIWLDRRAAHLCRERTPVEANLNAGSTDPNRADSELRAVGKLLSRAGHTLNVEKDRR